jgi:hypothetical protein
MRQPRKSRASTASAASAGGAAHHPGQLAGDDEARAAVGTCRRVVRLLEGGEQAPQLVGGDAAARILDLETHVNPLAVFLLAARTDGDRAAHGELDGIVGIVEQRLGDAGRVAEQMARQRGAIHDQLQPLLAQFRREDGNDVGEDCREIDVGLFGPELVGLDLGQVEDVVDHLQQVVGGGVDEVEVGHLHGANPSLRIRCAMPMTAMATIWPRYCSGSAGCR